MPYSCVAYIRRHCVGASLGREPEAGGGRWDGSLELTICPERSLAEQVKNRSPRRPVNIAPPKCEGRVRIYIPARLWTERTVFSPSQCS